MGGPYLEELKAATAGSHERRTHSQPGNEDDMNTVTESIFSGKSVIVALADVQHVEKWDKHSIPGIMVVTSHTKWNFEHDIWENAIWISEPEAADFRIAWCRYRSELESHTLMDLSPSLGASA